MCVLWWLSSLKFVVKELSQWLHGFGLSPVCFLVTNQISICNKIFFTVIAWYGFSPMCFLVVYQTTTCGKRFITVIALLWFITHVCSFVDHQAIICDKILASHWNNMVYHQVVFADLFCSSHLCIKALSQQLH